MLQGWTRGPSMQNASNLTDYKMQVVHIWVNGNYSVAEITERKIWYSANESKVSPLRRKCIEIKQWPTNVTPTKDSHFYKTNQCKYVRFFMKFKPTAYQGDTYNIVSGSLFIWGKPFTYISCSLEVLYLVRETGCYSCYHEVSTGKIY